MSDEKPFFDHDCDRCVFLGRVTKERPESFHHDILALKWQLFDLYFCKQEVGGPTVIARYGNKGPDYLSGLVAAEHEPLLVVAKMYAQEKGLLP